MARYDSNTSIKFSRGAQGSYALQKIALDAMQHSKNDRPSATEVHNQIVSIGLQKSCQRRSSSAPTKSFSDGELRTSTRHTSRRLTTKVSSPPPQSSFSPHPAVSKPNALVAPSPRTANRPPSQTTYHTPPQSNFSPHSPVNMPNALAAPSPPTTNRPPFHAACQTPNIFGLLFCQTSSISGPLFCQTPNFFCPPFCQTPNPFCSPFQMWCPTPPVYQFTAMMFCFSVCAQPQPFFPTF